MRKREELPTCEWCRDLIGGQRRFPRTLEVPTDKGVRRLKFHERCLQPFKDANPAMMKRKEAANGQVVL